MQCDIRSHVTRKKRRSWTTWLPISSSPTRKNLCREFSVKSSFNLEKVTIIPPSLLHIPFFFPFPYSYRIGESFFHVPLEKAQSMLEQAQERNSTETDALDAKLHTAQEEMYALKIDLYARFGKGINLDM